MKLTSLDLDLLRRGLRSHPRIAQDVVGLDLDRMRTRELVALTTRFGLDVRALIDTVREQDEERWIERMIYSNRFPAFEGTLQFDFTIEVLGNRVTQKARAEYTYTPAWEYWDLRKRAAYVGAAGSGLGMSVRIVPDKDGNDGGPLWKEIDILEIGELWEILDERSSGAAKQRAPSGGGLRAAKG